MGWGLRVHASGWDMAVNGTPSVSGSSAVYGSGADLPGVFKSQEEGVGAHPLMLLGILAVLTGAVAGSILQSVFARALAGLIASGAAAALIAANQVTVLVGLEDRVEEYAGWAGDEVAGGTRYGFWVTLVLLVAIAGYNLVEFLLSRRPPAGPVPGYGPPPSYGAGASAPPPWAPPYSYPPPHPGPPQHRPYGPSGPYGHPHG